MDILDLLLGRGKEFKLMDQAVRKRFTFAINAIEAAESLRDLGAIKSFNLTTFNRQHQLAVTEEKRLRFRIENDTVIIHFFGSTTHKGESS